MGITGVLLLLSGLAYAIIGIKKKMYVHEQASDLLLARANPNKGYMSLDLLHT